jgi:hypothetical protein
MYDTYDEHHQHSEYEIDSKGTLSPFDKCAILKKSCDWLMTIM